MEFTRGGSGDDDGTVGADEGETDENFYAAGSRTPSVIGDDELIAREKYGALITLHDAVWSVSSAKHGNGVQCLLDGSHSTFWQSDGVLPHTISIDFARLTSVAAIAVYLDFQQDESYTPRKIRVQAGTHSGDMADVNLTVVNDPQGWVMMRISADAETPSPWELGAVRGEDGTTTGGGAQRGRTTATVPLPADVMDNDDHAEFLEDGVWCTHLRIVLEENRQNGRDCHVRGVRVLGPVRQSLYTTASFTQHLVLR